MTKSDQLLAFVNPLLERQFKKIKTPQLEKLRIRIGVYDIFERNYDIEQIYYELIEYLEDEENLRALIPKIKEHYFDLNK